MRQDTGYGRGNIICDLGVRDPSIRQMKADAALAIASAMHERDLSIEQAAAIVRLDPARLRGIVSKGSANGLSLEQLMLAVEVLERRWRTS